MEVSESKITELFIYFLYVQDNVIIFFDRALCCLVCFLRKLSVREKTHLKFEKPWEMKNLPWDREKGSEIVWDTVKPWELRGLHQVLNILRNIFPPDLCIYLEQKIYTSHLLHPCLLVFIGKLSIHTHYCCCPYYSRI